MITKKDLEIANTSYINKDFQTIFPELLELTSKITDLWDPSTSNESDPGLTLLKLGAFIGDKNNYNTDKNTLENYMPSATQESSMWKLCDMMGYPIKYYNSATLPIYITLAKSFETTNTNQPQIISFEPLTLTVSNEDNTVVYTITEAFDLGENSKSLSVNAIEGSVKTLTISGNENEEIVQLENLDDNNRVYFPEVRVAQNGVFINTQENTEFWKSVDNLNIVKPMTKCFKFGFDSIRNLPYVEFPTYISHIIDNGLTIKYIISSGNNGNIKSRTLTQVTYVGADASTIINKFDSDNSESLTINDILSVANNTASLNGTNPQTIDEAYNGFKKTIGTYNTLVTSRDYANAIYNLKDATSGNPLVSNVQCADRRTDINYSNNIVTFKITNNDLYTISTSNVTDNNIVTPYDLMIYPLKPMSTTNKTIATYDNSYTRLTDITDISNELEDTQCISHNYKELNDDDIYAILNKYALNAVITTNKKVNSYESALILDNINLALINKFNARNVDYGEEIPYDSILKCIQTADENIKNVSLAEPVVTPYVLNAKGDEQAITETSDAFKNICVKNVLAGRVPLFKYNENFKLTYNQSDNTYIQAIKSISSNLSIVKSGLFITESLIDFNYTLRKNEMIQFLSPVYNTSVTYSFGVKYKYTGVDITSGATHTLTNDERLEVTYTSSGASITQTYTAGTTIQPSFKLEQTGDSVKTIAASSSINIVTKSEHTFTNKLQCYWLLNNLENKIPWNNNQYVLSEGEYFIYTNEDYTALSVLGSGTLLTRTNVNLANNPCSSNVTVEEITNNGLASFDILDWVTLNLTSDNTLTITDNQIVSLGEGDTLNDITLVNPLQTTTCTISTTTPLLGIKSATYSLKNDNTTTKLKESTDSWQAIARLNINCGPSTPQVLSNITNSDFSVTQTITLTKDSGSELIESKSLLLSNLIQHIGESDINVQEYVYNSNTGVYEYQSTLSGMSYTESAQTNVVASGDYYTISPSAFSNNSFTLNLPNLSNGWNGILMIYLQNNTGSITNNPTTTKTKNLNNANSTNLLDGVNCISVDNGTTSITITLNTTPTTNVVISVYTPYQLSDNLPKDIISSIQTQTNYSTFYFNHPTINSREVNVDDLLSADFYWDYNNLANKMTIAKIDFGKSRISISKSSRV